MSNLARSTHNDAVVSFDTEELILVDSDDMEVGHLHKDKCHDGEGLLHRAFSLFIFNDAGEVLIQKRSAQKRLWPMYWANTCCSHPRRGESVSDAVQRRLFQELGMHSKPEFLYKFIYHARFEDKGSEHELCWVFAGKSIDPVRANPNEIDEWKFLSRDELNAEIESSPESFSPWVKMEWETLQRDYQEQLDRIIRA